MAQNKADRKTLSHHFSSYLSQVYNLGNRVRDNSPDVKCDRKRIFVHFWIYSLFCIHFYSNQDVIMLKNHLTTFIWSIELPVSTLEDGYSRGPLESRASIALEIGF